MTVFLWLTLSFYIWMLTPWVTLKKTRFVRTWKKRLHLNVGFTAVIYKVWLTFILQSYIIFSFVSCLKNQCSFSDTLWFVNRSVRSPLWVSVCWALKTTLHESSFEPVSLFSHVALSEDITSTPLWLRYHCWLR